MFKAYDRIGRIEAQSAFIEDATSVGGQSATSNVSLRSNRAKRSRYSNRNLNFEEESAAQQSNTPTENTIASGQHNNTHNDLEEEPTYFSILSVFRLSPNSVIGICLYTEYDRSTFFGEVDSVDSLHKLKSTYQPDIILTSSSPSDPFYDELQLNLNDPDTPFQIFVEKRSSFSASDCRAKLNHVVIEDIPGLRMYPTLGSDDNLSAISGESLCYPSINEKSESFHSKAMRWMSVVDFSKPSTIAALSGLLSYLTQNCPQLHLNNIEYGHTEEVKTSSSVVVLKSISPFPTISTLYTDIATQKALNIFTDEQHPGGGRKKEGLSVFGLLNQTKSVCGSRLLRFWLQHPSTDAKIIESRHDHIEYLSFPHREEMLNQLRSSLSHVKDIPRILSRFFAMASKYTDWIALHESLRQIVAIHTTLQAAISNSTAVGSTGGNKNDPFASSRLFQHAPRTEHGGNFVGKSAIAPSLLHSPPQLIRYLGASLPSSLADLNGLLMNTLDIPSTRREGRVVIRGGIHPGLDALKGRYAVIEQFLADVLHNDLESGILPPLFPTMHYCYFPQLGYLLAVPRENGDGQTHGYSTSTVSMVLGRAPDERNNPSQHSQLQNPSIQSLPGMEFQFQTDEYIFYSTARTRELDAELGDIQAQIFDLERELAQALAQAVAEAATEMENYAERITELDVLIALSVASKDFGLVRPQITQANGLHIVNGRHVLYEVCLDRFIPNSLTLFSFLDEESRKVFGPLYEKSEKGRLKRGSDKVNDSNLDVEEVGEKIVRGSEEMMNMEKVKENDQGAGLVHVITGPNNSGKSVLLKQVGIIVYLAHIGSFVPAESAVIGICDQLLARVPTADSVVSEVSTFARDISQMSLLLRSITPRTLVLSDEFGSGTNTHDGIALCTALLQYLISLDEKRIASSSENILRSPVGCPKALITTHFHEMFTYGLIAETPLLRFHNMACAFTGQSKFSKPVLEYLDSSSQPVKVAGEKPEESFKQSLVPLFKLAEGWSDNSFGFNCAYNAGIPEEVVERATEIAQLLQQQRRIEPQFPSGLSLTPSIASDLQAYSHVIDSFIKLAPKLIEDTAECFAGVEALLQLITETVQGKVDEKDDNDKQSHKAVQDKPRSHSSHNDVAGMDLE